MTFLGVGYGGLGMSLSSPCSLRLPIYNSVASFAISIASSIVSPYASRERRNYYCVTPFWLFSKFDNLTSRLSPLIKFELLLKYKLQFKQYAHRFHL